MKQKRETTKFDVQDHLKSPEERAAYVEAAFEDGDPAVIAKAVGDVARAVGISSLSRENRHRPRRPPQGAE